MTPQEALAAYYKAVGDRLTRRIADLWPYLTDQQRVAIREQTDTDGMTTLLGTYEADLTRVHLAASAGRQAQLLNDAGPDLAAELLAAEAVQALRGHWPECDRVATVISSKSGVTRVELLGVLCPDDTYDGQPIISRGEQEVRDLAEWLLNAAVSRAQPRCLTAHRIDCYGRDHVYEVAVADTMYRDS
ncbi:MAG TPA: hypothetical protein VJT31_20925 [Rugosimonospora sp.]|nr:hypothetical protein [Rugosimonospora sp.]